MKEQSDEQVHRARSRRVQSKQFLSPWNLGTPFQNMEAFLFTNLELSNAPSSGFLWGLHYIGMID